METTRSSRINVGASWKPSFPFDELRQLHRNTRPVVPAHATPSAGPKVATVPASFVKFLELARLRCQFIDANVTFS